MSVGLKIALLAILGVFEAVMAFVMWRRFMLEGRSRLAVLMVAQAVGTFFVFAVILFVLLE